MTCVHQGILRGMAPPRKPGTNHHFADGKNCYCDDCKAKNRARMKRRAKDEPQRYGRHRESRRFATQYGEKQERIRQIKVEQGCARCGYNEHPAALEFDHLPGTVKLFNVGSMAAAKRSWETIMAEIAKCQVVCANCHRVITAERRLVP